MRKIILGLVLLAFVGALDAQESQNSKRGDAAGYATRDASLLSMVGWGVTIAVGVATLCALIENHTSHTH